MKTKYNIRSFVPTIIVGSLVALGIVIGMVVSPVRAQSTFASIGYVDLESALQAHPQLDNIQAQIQAFEDARIEELSQSYGNFDSLTDAQRQQFMQDVYDIQTEVDAEGRRLSEPLIQDVIDATTAIGEESGIEVILEAGSVMWGGLDLTPLIINRLQSN
jgi:Skp family chaperone for outer membrane proteins